jgi:hypothetical protein
MDVKLLQLMEEFVLKEVYYSQQHGYSGRAKRYMRRKLTNEISSFLENIESETESDSDDTENENTPHENEASDENTFNKMIYCDYKSIHNRIDLCFLMTYLMFLGTLYSSIAYLICSYKEIHVQIPLPLQYSNQSEQFSKSCL